MKKIAYHFLKDDMCGGYGNEPPWKEGEERELLKDRDLIMCQQGYHASPSFYDALRYARGNIVCIVELSGKILRDTDKFVARKRKLIKAVNAEKVLREWGCACAERALKKSGVTDERSWNAIKVTRLFSNKEWDAAWNAARTAARDAAWTATRDVARTAAWDVARTAAWAAEIKWQKRHLNRLIKELLNESDKKHTIKDSQDTG